MSGATAIGEDDDDATIGVLESTDDNTGDGSRGTDTNGTRTDVTRPHGEGPQDGVGNRFRSISVDEMGGRLHLLVLEALPEEICGEISLDDTDSKSLRPRETFILSTVRVPCCDEGV